MTKKYDLVVFDWDGTLMNSEGRIVACMQLAAADVGLEVPSQAASRDIIGLGLEEAIRRLFPMIAENQVRGVTEAYRDHWMGNQVEAAVMFEGAHALISELHASGHLLAVATGKSRRGLNKSLAESGLGEYFHATRCADETFSKPHPQMLEEILVDLDTPAARAVVVGDTEYDMQMASNATVSAVGVTHGVHSVERLFEHGAVDCFDSLPALSNWLNQRTAQ